MSILKDYEIPSGLKFYEGKIQRNIGFLYGLNIDENSYASIIKVPACQYKDGKFNSFFNFKSNGQGVSPFENNYPQENSYKEICKLYAIKNADNKIVELKWSPLTNRLDF